jgi:hypothetical protein
MKIIGMPVSANSGTGRKVKADVTVSSYPPLCSMSKRLLRQRTGRETRCC